MTEEKIVTIPANEDVTETENRVPCKYKEMGCTGSVTCDGNEPVYPPCSEFYEPEKEGEYCPF